MDPSKGGNRGRRQPLLATVMFVDEMRSVNDSNMRSKWYTEQEFTELYGDGRE